MKSDLFSGHTLFHVHTTYADGKLTVKDYFQYAKSQGLDRIIFLEHIRNNPTYDVAEFVGRVRWCSQEYSIKAHVGFESKLLPNGRLDISDEHLARAEVIGLAEHGFPNDPALLFSAFFRAVQSYRNQGITLVWLHPGLFFQRNGILHTHYDQYLCMIEYALGYEIYVEQNVRHNLISLEHADRLPSKQVVTGADAHVIEDLIAWRNMLECR